MKNIFNGVKMDGVDTAFSVPHGGGGGLEVSDVEARNVKTLYVERDKVNGKDLLTRLGLPRETDEKILAQVILDIARQKPEHRPPMIQERGFLAKLLGGSDMSVSLVANLVSLATNPAVVGWAKTLAS